MSKHDQQVNLDLAKTIPFSKTKEEIYSFLICVVAPVDKDYNVVSLMQKEAEEYYQQCRYFMG